VTKRIEDTQTNELAALTGLLDYAFAMARDLDKPFLAHLIRMAADESRRARDGQDGVAAPLRSDGSMKASA
jgi:hypothetical protein